MLIYVTGDKDIVNTTKWVQEKMDRKMKRILNDTAQKVRNGYIEFYSRVKALRKLHKLGPIRKRVGLLKKVPGPPVHTGRGFRENSPHRVAIRERFANLGPDVSIEEVIVEEVEEEVPATPQPMQVEPPHQRVIRYQPDGYSSPERPSSPRDDIHVPDNFRFG